MTITSGMLNVIKGVGTPTPTYAHYTLLGKANYETTCSRDMDPSQNYEATTY